MRRNVAWILMIAVAHAALTMATLLVTGGLVMRAFDGTRAPSVADGMGLWVLRILMMPLGYVPDPIPQAWSDTVPPLRNLLFFMNSLLWGIAIVWLLRRRGILNGHRR
jgi:hypothetical protein